MASVRIRPFQPADLEETVGLWRRARRAADAAAVDDGAYTHGDDLAYFRDYVCRRCTVWVAAAGGRVAGFIALAASHVDQLYVDPPRQSSGIGGALLDHAKAISPGGLTLTVAPRNAAARRFYERHGFVAIDTGDLRDHDDDAPAGEEGEVLYAWRA